MSGEAGQYPGSEPGEQPLDRDLGGDGFDAPKDDQGKNTSIPIIATPCFMSACLPFLPDKECEKKNPRVQMHVLPFLCVNW